MLITETIIDFSKLASEQKKRFFKKIWIFDQQIFPNSSVEEIYNFVICAELAGDFHLGYARQLTDKSSLLFDLAF